MPTIGKADVEVLYCTVCVSVLAAWLPGQCLQTLADRVALSSPGCEG